MERFFNTAGPIKTDLHYYIDPLKRLDLDEVLFLIRQQKCFVMHALPTIDYSQLAVWWIEPF